MSEREPRPSCPRTWEIAAVRDGRLDGHDSGSLERHVENCAICATERDELDALADSLRQLPRPPMDDLAARRIRQRVLMDHNAWLLRRDQSPARTRRPPKLLIAASALALAALSAWGLFRWRQATYTTAQLTTPRVDIVASAGALFRRESSPHAVVVTLDDGELHLAIQRDNPSERVTIVLPDGEIEDRGTVLDVAVTNGQTQRLDIERGSVVLKLRASSPLTLAAGDSWRRKAVQAALPPASAAPDASATPPLPSARHEHATAGARSHAGSGVTGPRPSSSLDAAASAEAERAAKAEDDAYLHVVELAGSGHNDEARAAAKDYLVQFPNGFRRLEVLNIATRTAR